MYEVPRVALVRAVKEGKLIAADIIRLQLMVNNGYMDKNAAADMYEFLLQRVDAIQGRAEKAQEAVRELGPASLGPLPEEAMRGMAELRVLAAELRAGKEPAKVQEEMVRVNATLVGPAMTKWFERGVGEYNMVNDAEASGRTLCTQVTRFVALGPRNEGVAVAGVNMPPLPKTPTQRAPGLPSPHSPVARTPSADRYVPRSPSPEPRYVPRTPSPEPRYVPRSPSPEPRYEPRSPSLPPPTAVLPSPEYEPRSPSLPPPTDVLPSPEYEPRSPSLPPPTDVLPSPEYEPRSPSLPPPTAALPSPEYEPVSAERVQELRAMAYDPDASDFEYNPGSPFDE